MEIVKSVGTKTALLYGADKLGAFNNPSNNMIKQNLMLGTVFYFTQEIYEQITEGKSNLTEMSAVKAIDDIVWLSVGSAVSSTLNIPSMISKSLPIGDRDLQEAVTGSLIMEGTLWAGEKMEQTSLHWLRNITNKFI